MVLVFFGAMARFLKRPSPSEAIIRIGRATTDVFIGRACWIVRVLHRAATMSLSTIGLTIRREGKEALVTKDFISTNLIMTVGPAMSARALDSSPRAAPEPDGGTALPAAKLDAILAELRRQNGG